MDVSVIGKIQRLYWRRDRHCFFMNWIVIVDVRGFIVLSRPGFVGHLHDSTCFTYNFIIYMGNGFDMPQLITDFINKMQELSFRL